VTHNGTKKGESKKSLISEVKWEWEKSCKQENRQTSRLVIQGGGNDKPKMKAMRGIKKTKWPGRGPKRDQKQERQGKSTANERTEKTGNTKKAKRSKCKPCS